MALKRARLQVLQRAGAIPRALVVRVKHIAEMVQTNAAGAANAAGSGDHLAFLVHAHTPAAVRSVAVEGTGETQDHPHVAVGIELRSKGVLVVIAVDAPAVGEGFKDIRTTIAVLILDARYFAALRGVQPAVAPVNTKRLVQPAGKELHLHIVRLAERIANGVDIAAAGTDSKVAVGQHRNATGFEHDVFRQWDSGEVVVVLLLRLSLSGETGQQQAGDQCKFFHHQISLNSFS